MASFKEFFDTDGSLKSIKVYWSLPKALIPAGQKKATGSLTVYTRADCRAAIRIAELHKHRIHGDQVADLLAQERAQKASSSDSVMTLGKWFGIWISNIDDTKTSQRQIDTYAAQFKNEILRRLGDKPLSDIEPIDVQGLYRELRDSGMESGTVRTYHAALHACLNVAIANPKTSGITFNPAKGLKPKIVQPEDEDRDPEKYFERHTYDLILESVHPDSRMFIKFLGDTGARFSEATALQVQDLDFKNNIAEIDRAHKRTYSGRMLKQPGQPKGKSDRWIEVPPSYMRELHAYVNRRGLSGGDSIFHAPRGGRIHHSNFLSRRWAPMMHRLAWCPAHMPSDLKMASTCTCLGDISWTTFRPHALRHSWATWAILSGVPISLVSRQLGHPDTAFTERTYVHLLKAQPLGVGLALDQYLGRVA